MDNLRERLKELSEERRDISIDEKDNKFTIKGHNKEYIIMKQDNKYSVSKSKTKQYNNIFEVIDYLNKEIYLSDIEQEKNKTYENDFKNTVNILQSLDENVNIIKDEENNPLELHFMSTNKIIKLDYDSKQFTVLNTEDIKHKKRFNIFKMIMEDVVKDYKNYSLDIKEEDLKLHFNIKNKEEVVIRINVEAIAKTSSYYKVFYNGKRQYNTLSSWSDNYTHHEVCMWLYFLNLLKGE